MKKILSFICSAAILAACSSGANEFGRIDQIDESIPQPQPVSQITEVRAISGGAIIKVKIPDDKNIKGVVATYERNGEQIQSKISRYVDSLRIEGFRDTQERSVEICTFNSNETKSTPTIVKISPLAPAIQTVVPEMSATAGGIKVKISGNSDKSDLAVCILRDADLSDKDKPVSDIKWVEVTTLFTASDNISLTRRGIEAEEAIFGVYIRDHWGNISDTIKTVLTPMVEVMIPKAGFKYADPGDDNIFQMSSESSTYPVKGLWDGTGTSAAYCFFAVGTCPIPAWLTIDMGHTCELSRIATLPRIAYTIWANAHPRDFEFWGSMAPTGREGSNEHGFDDTWVCLGKFTQYKPSGYEEDGSVGTVTQEDSQYFNAGNDFELDPEAYPHSSDRIRYLRIVFASTFATFELKNATEAAGIQFGEITPYGQVFD